MNFYRTLRFLFLFLIGIQQQSYTYTFVYESSRYGGTRTYLYEEYLTVLLFRGDVHNFFEWSKSGSLYDLESSINNFIKLLIDGKYNSDLVIQKLDVLEKELAERISYIKDQIKNKYFFDQCVLKKTMICSALLALFSIGTYCSYQKIDLPKLQKFKEYEQECYDNGITIDKSFDSDGRYITKTYTLNPMGKDKTREELWDILNEYVDLDQKRRENALTPALGACTVVISFFEILHMICLCTKDPNQFNDCLSKYEQLLDFVIEKKKQI